MSVNYSETYDVFISYRRDGGETMATLLRDRLAAKGFRVFLDIESLNSGSFNQALLSVIEGCIDVVLVCSKDCLDRCANDGDWVRTEIAFSLTKGKNVVPLMLRGFEWPEVLPADINELRMQNGVNAQNHEYFDAAIDRLTEKFLKSKPFNSVQTAQQQYTEPVQYTAPQPQYAEPVQQQYTEPVQQPQYTAPVQPPQYTAPVQQPQYNTQHQQQYAAPAQQYIPHEQQQYAAYNMSPAAAVKKTPVGLIAGIAGGALALIITVIILIFVLGGDDEPQNTGRTRDDPPNVPVINQEDPPPVIPSGPLAPAEIFANNKWAVMLIRGTCANGWEYTGSGFFISSSGIAVTNHHVMDGLVKATAILYDGSEFDITGYYSYDFANDIAIVQVDGKGKVFEYVVLGNSDEVRVGDNVYAIGGPDWDPITFTDGMVSRIAYESMRYDGYSVEGMFQSTAAIYGGNSGGPLVDDRGCVIGINSAGRPDRPSVQFAVPINRVERPSPGASVNSLPIGGRTPVHLPGQTIFFDLYPTIPDFLSVSSNTWLFLAGSAVDMEFDYGGLYQYVYLYELQTRFFVQDTDAYDALLMQHGFIFQDVVLYEEETWVYLFHPTDNISVSYCFFIDYDMLMIAIGRGNAYETHYGSSIGGGGSPNPGQPGGYEWYPEVLDFGGRFPNARFLEEGRAGDLLGGEISFSNRSYILDFEHIFCYEVLHSNIADIDTYIALLQSQWGFDLTSETVYEAEWVYAAMLILDGGSFWNTWVSVVYWYEYELLVISVT
jgi:S1-C subfamily serine protease